MLKNEQLLQPIVCKNTLTVWTAALSFLLHVLAAEYAVMGMLAYQGVGV